MIMCVCWSGVDTDTYIQVRQTYRLEYSIGYKTNIIAISWAKQGITIKPVKQ